MKRKLTLWGVVVLALAVLGLAGCASPGKNVSKLRLGDTPEVVLDKMGKPNTVRASKVYEDESSVEIWEYLPGVFTFYPKAYWLYVEDGRLVQWGEPGDFAGKSGSNVPVGEYSDKKRLN
ncbi:MAG: hypothetical protein KJ726_09665 [Verrucomicrobia bacterium]|nr:hypothetical protein [Verrucomicrobiota bacterium]MBU1910302.1 hypothetical protein [Verrucomicrobiota bacterium]